MRGTPPKSQSQSQAMPILLEPGLEDAEAGEEHQPQDQPEGAGPPLGPEVDGTEEEIPQGDGQEGNPWEDGEKAKQNPLWDYCAEPWTHRLNRIALSDEFETITEAARDLDFGRKYWRGVSLEVWHMDKMAKRHGIEPISQTKKQEEVDQAREKITKINCEQTRKEIQDPDAIAVATDGGADPETGSGSGGGVTWYLPPDPLAPVPTPQWASCCGVISEIPEADPDSFDGEGFAVVHHCEQMRASLSPMVLKTVQRFVFYVDASGLLQALDAFNDKSSPLVIRIVRSLEELEKSCTPGVVFEFRWTPGHMGNPFNDYADYMASQGLCHALGMASDSVKHGNKKTGSVPVMECPFCGIPVVPSCDHFLFGCQGKEAFGRIRSEFGEQKKAKKREETTVTDKVVQDYAEWIARFV
eukprot:g7208.t1